MKWILIFSLILVEVHCKMVRYHRFMNDPPASGKKIIFQIVGGSTTSITKYKHQVQLGYLVNATLTNKTNSAKTESLPVNTPVNRIFSHICGASAITKNAILCAAHCVTDQKPENYIARFGTSERNAGGTVLEVDSIVVHPDYNDDTYDCDVSLFFFFKTDISSLPNVALIPMIGRTESFADGTATTVTGWGTMSEGGKTSPELREVTIPCISSKLCNEKYKSMGGITKNMFCTWAKDGGKDSCQGDSGGPLIANVNGVTKLIGVVSWGNGCARKAFPGVYAKLTAPDIRDFIDNTLADPTRKNKKKKNKPKNNKKKPNKGKPGSKSAQPDDIEHDEDVEEVQPTVKPVKKVQTQTPVKSAQPKDVKNNGVFKKVQSIVKPVKKVQTPVESSQPEDVERDEFFEEAQPIVKPLKAVPAQSEDVQNDEDVEHDEDTEHDEEIQPTVKSIQAVQSQSEDVEHDEDSEEIQPNSNQFKLKLHMNLLID